MEVILTLLFAALFSYVVYKNPFFHADGITAKTSTGLYILKACSGLVLALIYTFYYTERADADIYKYFDDGKYIYDLLFTDPQAYFQIVFGINTETPHILEILDQTRYWYKPFESPLYNDNRTLIRFNALAHLISFGSIGVHTVIMCMLSYVGLFAMYKTFVHYLKGKEMELILAFFLLPSILFWGSGVLKEGILIFALGIFLFAWMRLLKQKFRWSNLILLVFALGLLLLSKIYVLLALAPPLIAYSWCYLTSQKHVVAKYLFLFILGFFGALSIHFIFPDYDLLGMMADKQRDFINVATLAKASSLYDIPVLEANLWSLLKGIPLAIGNVAFRPHIFEAGNIMMLMAAAENLMILSVIVMCIIFSKKPVDNWNFLFFCIGFVVILFALIGLITPIFGAVVRYKIPALPFLLIIFLLIFDKEKFISKFPVFKFLNK